MPLKDTITNYGVRVLNNPNYELLPTQPTVYDITPNVNGSGAYIVNEGVELEFLHGVGAGQTIKLNAGWHTPTGLMLDDPVDFHGHIEINYKQPSGYFLSAKPGTEQVSIAMQMIGQAVNSYSYHNDMLKLWSGNHVVQQLNLTVHDPYGITVQANQGSIVISANDRSNHGIDFDGFQGGSRHYGIMPVHV